MLIAHLSARVAAITQNIRALALQLLSAERPDQTPAIQRMTRENTLTQSIPLTQVKAKHVEATLLNPRHSGIARLLHKGSAAWNLRLEIE